MSSSSDPIVIVHAKRTAIGSFQGMFKTLSAAQLGAATIANIVEETKLPQDAIQEVIMGCVLPAGQGQAPARQAALYAQLPKSCGAVTVNKMCGSGMKAVMMAHDMIAAGTYSIMIAGGMESMTNAPYLLPKVRAGLRMGHSEVQDSMFLDGLEDAYDKGTLMGVFAERTAEKYGFTREQQDAFAVRSLERAQKATAQFKREIVPIKIASKTGDLILEIDELPTQAKPEKIPTLKPAFKKDGTVTAANSSGISDGAASLLLMRKSTAEKMQLPIRAIIHAHSTFAQAPEWFTTAPVGAMQAVLKKANWDVNQVDFFEINEAFAVVTMAALHDLSLPQEKVNVYGGACALGHPIGASGARILCTLLNVLETNQKKRGVASLCIGGGEATAMAIECVS